VRVLNSILPSLALARSSRVMIATAMLCVVVGSGSAGFAADAVSEPSNAATPARLRLVTSEQYLNTLTYVFGIDLKVDPRFAPLRRTEGLLQNAAAIAGVTDSQLEQFQRTAATVASQLVGPERRSFLMSCKPASETKADKTCAAAFLSANGRFLYRRALTRAEVKEAVDTASIAADRLKDFYAGLAIALEGMLLDPEVLYIAETSEPDPNHPGRQRLGAYSLASRLSYFLWNAAPDDQLLKAAESGEIQTANGRARVVDMMLKSPRLTTGMRAFFDDMFGFDDFNAIAKDPAVYPSFTGVTLADAREQTLRTVIDHLIARDLDYRGLYTTRSTFISPALAALYELPAPDGWAPYEFPPDSARMGLLTQISFLAGHSHPGRSSPTLRGKALREVLLCQVVPRPPANVDFSAVDNPSSNIKTQRERVGMHLRNPVCAGCHKITDPTGLALENFDGAGRYRDAERGAPIDPSGNLDGTAFKDVKGLAVALHDHPALPGCLVKRLYGYASGGAPGAADQPMLDYLSGGFAAKGYRLPDLLRTIALSNAFSNVAERDVAPVRAVDAAPARNAASAVK
jgi:hypothetical protein